MTVKELLGHATLTMTIRYSHLALAHRLTEPSIPSTKLTPTLTQ